MTNFNFIEKEKSTDVAPQRFGVTLNFLFCVNKKDV